MKKLVSLTQREVIDFSLESLYHNKQVFIDMEMGMGKTITTNREGVCTGFWRGRYRCPGKYIIPRNTSNITSSYSRSIVASKILIIYSLSSIIIIE